MPKKMHLIWFGATGMMPSRTADGGYQWGGGVGRKGMGAEIVQDIARACERACLDMVLFADISVIPETFGGGRDLALRSGIAAVAPDALPYIGYMGAVTSKIGLGVTVSATYFPPFILARMFGTYDHLTGGRFAWNVVTQTNELTAKNYGYDLLEHDQRYEMAQEHMDLVKALWSSWEPDAIIMDHENGVFAAPAKVHTVDFVGKHYRSRGPLVLPQTPQGHPVIIQAGNSPRGIEFAAKNAEVVITHQHTIAGIKNYVEKVRAAAAAAGRDPYSIKIFSSINPTMGPTDFAAQELWQRRLALASVEEGLNYLSYTLNLDLSTFSLDEPLPADLEVTGIRGKFDAMYPKGEPRRTLRELAKLEAMNETIVMTGSYENVAAQMEHVRDETGLDGFHVRATTGFAYCVDFLENVIPVLQHRGLFRTEYRGDTLRDHLMEY